MHKAERISRGICCFLSSYSVAIEVFTFESFTNGAFQLEYQHLNEQIYITDFYLNGLNVYR